MHDTLLQYYYSGYYFRYYLFISDIDRKSLVTKEMAIEAKGIGFDIELKLKRTSFELLSTPYMQSCDQDIKNQFESSELYHNNCSSDPFIYENFILFDSKKFLNEKCEKTLVSIANKIKSCKEDYYKIIAESNLPKPYEDSKFKLHGNFLIDHKYTAYPRMGLVEFMANIGGLFGLWLGMSVIDMSEIIKLLIPLFKNISKCLKKLTIFKLFRTKFFNFILEILQIQQFVENINWKRLFTIMSIPVLIVQFYQTIEDYLSFSTSLSFSFIPYNRNNTKYSLSDFPAITVCNEHIFDKIFFEEELIKIYNESLRVELYKSTIYHSWHEMWQQLVDINAMFKTSNDNISTPLQIAVLEMAGFEKMRSDRNLSRTRHIAEFMKKYLDVENREDYYNRSKMLNQLQGKIRMNYIQR